jgi:hypothetical protein
MFYRSLTTLPIVIICLAFVMLIYMPAFTFNQAFAQGNQTSGISSSNQTSNNSTSGGSTAVGTGNTTGTSAANRPFETDAQKYNNGYSDGLMNSERDFRGLSGHGCDPTVPPGHTPQYQKGYPVGYSKGPCGSGTSASSTSGSSSSPVPGLLFSP